MTERKEYWEGYKKVYVLKYCTGEVGKLVWHNRGIYKSKKIAELVKKNTIVNIFNLRSSYFDNFKKVFDSTNIENLSQEEKRYIILNSDVRITNVVVTPYRLEDTLKQETSIPL
jgi:hypothetical protein